MRYPWLVLLVSTAVQANVDADSNSEILTLDTKVSIRSITSSGQHVPINRLLRVYESVLESVNNDDTEHNTGEAEERGVSTSAVETLTNSLKSADELDDWFKKGESTNAVFKLLTLDKAADDLLANPKLQDWISYMKRFNQENPTKKVSLIATLTSHYGDDGLAKIIEAAKQVPSTAGIAKRVQTEQIQRWLVDKKSPEDVFKLLKLDDAGPDLFAQPQIVTWAKFLDDFKKLNRKSETTLFSFLKSRYDEETLVHMLIAAKNVPTTKKIAIRIQAAQTSLWLKDKKEPAEVFKLLKLDDINAELPLLKNPLFNAWVKYTDDYRKYHFGSKFTTISVLREFYEDDVLAMMILTASKSSSTHDIAKRLFTEQSRNWYISKFDPEDVFKLLKLDTANVPLFENSLFNVWTRFMVYFSDLRPQKDVSLLTVLTKIYNERGLSDILVAARKAPQTKKLATDLLNGQFERWLLAKRDPLGVFYVLRVLEAPRNDVRKVIYDNYRYAFDRRYRLGISLELTP